MRNSLTAATKPTAREVWSPDDGMPYRWNEGGTNESVAYGRFGTTVSVDEVLPGWWVNVHCAQRTAIVPLPVGA